MIESPDSRNKVEPYISVSDHLKDEAARLDLLLRAGSLARSNAADSAAKMRRDGLGESLTRLDAIIEQRCEATEEAGHRLPWRNLAKLFGLDDLEMEIVLLLLAVEGALPLELPLDLIEADGVTPHSMLAYLGWNPARQMVVRTAISPAGRLQEWHMLDRRKGGGLALDPAIVDYLLGLPPEQHLGSGFTAIEPPEAEELPGPVVDQLDRLARLLSETETNAAHVVLIGLDAMQCDKAAAYFAELLNFSAIQFDLAWVKQIDDPLALQRSLRGALLADAQIVCRNAAALSGPEHATARAQLLLALTESYWLTVWTVPDIGQIPELPTDALVYRISLPLPDQSEREVLWAKEAPHLAEPQWGHLAASMSLTAEQISTATAQARAAAGLDGRAEPDLEDLSHAASAVSRHDLSSLARLVSSRYGWDDIELEPDTKASLQALCRQHQQRDIVFGNWGFDAKGSQGRGVTAIFSGPPGTGKTMAASVIGQSLGRPVYKIDLSMMVSKYIGETEKNLTRLFDETEHSNSIILFDEADALFGKRTEVKDAHDRFANIEVSHLLQRIEGHTGVVLLSTNLIDNIDEAFLRRMRAVINFPLPEYDVRVRIWDRFLEPLPVAPDIDTAFLGETVTVSGGLIRNIVMNAAFEAAATDGKVDMAKLIRATEVEYRKAGRMFVEADFSQVTQAVAAP